MGRLRAIATALIVGGAFALGSGGGADAQSPCPASPKLDLSLRISDRSFAPEEPIEVILEVTNRTRETIRLTFSTSQRFDLTLQDSSGQVIWRWSEGRFFLQMIGEELLTPDIVALRFVATIAAPPKRGRYILRGLLTSSNWPHDTSIPIWVR